LLKLENFDLKQMAVIYDGLYLLLTVPVSQTVLAWSSKTKFKWQVTVTRLKSVS